MHFVSRPIPWLARSPVGCMKPALLDSAATEWPSECAAKAMMATRTILAAQIHDIIPGGGYQVSDSGEHAMPARGDLY